MNKKQRLDEWIRRLKGFPEYDKAIKGLRREFREGERGRDLSCNNFNGLFWWSETKEGHAFWENVEDWLIDRNLQEINPVRELIAKAKKHPELAELAKRAEESL